jgi:hypothetical protein
LIVFYSIPLWSPYPVLHTPNGLIGPANLNNHILENLASSNLEHDKADIIDWRKLIIGYLQDPSHKVDRKIWWLTFKLTLVEGSYKAELWKICS